MGNSVLILSLLLVKLVAFGISSLLSGWLKTSNLFLDANIFFFLMVELVF